MKFDTEIRYECIQCGKSCRRDWNVWLRDDLRKRIGHGYQALRMVQDGEALRLERDESGCSCLEGNQCGIHQRLGYHSKPYSCKQYPILLVQTPDGLRVSASYTCTAVLQQSGPPLEAHQSEVRRWLGRGGDIDHIHLEPEPWRQVQKFEKAFESLVEEMGWERASRQAFWALTGRGQVEPAVALESGSGPEAEPTSLDPLLLGALLKPCLPSRDRSSWERLDQQLLQGLPVEIKDYSYRGPAGEIVEWSQLPLTDESALERYRKSLWFREQHLRCGGLAAGMLMLWKVGSLFRVLGRLDSVMGALEAIELNLLGHTRAAERIFPMLETILCQKTSDLR